MLFEWPLSDLVENKPVVVCMHGLSQTKMRRKYSIHILLPFDSLVVTCFFSETCMWYERKLHNEIESGFVTMLRVN